MSATHRVEPLRRIERFCDAALVPVMFVLGGCRRDSLQETHFWHCQRLSHVEIDPALTVSVTGDDPVWTRRLARVSEGASRPRRQPSAVSSSGVLQECLPRPPQTWMPSSPGSGASPV